MLHSFDHRNRVLGTLNVGSMTESAFSARGCRFSEPGGRPGRHRDRERHGFQEIAELKDQLAEEKLYLEDEIRTEQQFRRDHRRRSGLSQVLDQVATVAPTDASVLILGETGTGKELIARAIHELSGRRERTFVKLNCAAIPTGLLESELFGHEKGAFTGAIAQKVGRFELANKGTLFLDEVGDIPLELQPKLLRALQEQEFERLGGTRTIKVDVRLVAATNRDLAQMIAERQFRSDLYYRLSVFPISLPPLRERADDIPKLVRYFTQKYARRMNKRIETIPSADHGGADALRLAGQRAGAGESDRARRDSDARHQPGDSAGRTARRPPIRRAGDARRRRARSHPARAGASELGGRRTERSRGPPGHETHYAAIQDEEARNRALG